MANLGCEFNEIDWIVETAQKHGVIIEHLSPADTATLDEALPNRPRPSSIHFLTLGASVIVVLVQDGVVILSTDPIELAQIKKILRRTDA